MRTHFSKCKGPKEEHKKKKCSKHKVSKVPSSDKSKESHHKSKTKKDKAEKEDKHDAKEKKPHGSPSKSVATTASPEHSSGTVHVIVYASLNPILPRRNQRNTCKEVAQEVQIEDVPIGTRVSRDVS